MSDRLALANAIEEAGIERAKAEQLAATSAGTHLGGNLRTGRHHAPSPVACAA